MQIKLNGEIHTLPAAMNMAELVAHLGLNATQVAIERNRTIVPRSTHAEVSVEEGDEIEIVKFIGGG